MGVHVAA